MKDWSHVIYIHFSLFSFSYCPLWMSSCIFVKYFVIYIQMSFNENQLHMVVMTVKNKSKRKYLK